MYDIRIHSSRMSLPTLSIIREQNDSHCQQDSMVDGKEREIAQIVYIHLYTVGALGLSIFCFSGHGQAACLGGSVFRSLV